MPITSSVAEDQAKGRGHFEHGNGKGLGHLKHAEADMADGLYTMTVGGVSHDNPTSVSQTSVPTTLVDGSAVTTEVRQGSILSEDGALRFETDSANGRLRFNVGLEVDDQVTLGELDQLNFRFLVDSSDRSDVAPVLRLVVDGDGDLATTADRGELVFEWAYQGSSPVAQDVWQTADLAGDDWVAWQRSNGQNRDQIANMAELSDWADGDGYTPTGGVQFDADSLVLGWSLALGSGNGTTVASVDSLQFGGVTYDFV